MPEITPFQDHLTIQDVRDIISLKKALPKSLDTTDNMSVAYTICLDFSILQVQDARRKVSIQSREAIEKHLQVMVDQQLITPVTEPMEWVSSLTYYQKPDTSLHICLDPQNLNKAITQEHYKAPTLDKITHRLSGAQVFSKLDAVDSFGASILTQNLHI